MDITYRPYIDPDYEVLIERIHPPRVCIDNDTYPDCTLVKVDSANKHGMLLEMVQVLTDLDLLISKSYVSSDGDWLMDVFHVTDQLGNKITDHNLIRCIQEGICARRQGGSRITGQKHVSTDHMALEMTGIDRPGLMSEMSAVLSELGCNVLSAVAWTHNGRAACIIYMDDNAKGGVIMDACRVAQVQAQIENVVEAHHCKGERRTVTLTAPAPGQTHTERRLHQLMAADRDYEECCCCCCSGNSELEDIYVYGGCRRPNSKKGCDSTHVKIEKCKENGYLIITVRSKDRPKLLFDTVCALTDMEYVVYHAAISSQGSAALQEYYVKHKDGYAIDSEGEKHKVTQCLIAASERRVSHGLRLEISTENRVGLLSDITRVLRENGLSITRAEIGIRGSKAVGTFYVKDTSGQNVNPRTQEIVRQEIGGNCTFVENKSLETYPEAAQIRGSSSSSRCSRVEEKPKFSLGNLIWTHLERLSGSFKPVQS